jgi:anti-anti-sigma regulatory factor
MLRVEFSHDGNGALIVRLFGRMVGPYAEDARNALADRPLPASIAVDLSEVTFVDSFGEQVLLWLGRLGAKFVANHVYVRSVCERLQLHVSEKPTGVDPERDTSVLP